MSDSSKEGMADSLKLMLAVGVFGLIILISALIAAATRLDFEQAFGAVSVSILTIILLMMAIVRSGRS